MSYLIDAKLEQGIPSLILIDPETGEERLRWRYEKTLSPEKAWQILFKRLALLSCADRVALVQRAVAPGFGEECVECSTCAETGVQIAANSLQADRLLDQLSKARCS